MQTKQALPIIYNEIKDYFKLDSEGNLWNLLTTANRHGKKGEWHPCYQNKPNKSCGYLVVRFKGISYKQHRIVYSLATKQDTPTDLYIDHIDGNRVNNNIDNLRLVSHRENQQNQVKHRQGGLVGTNYDKQRKKWQARIRIVLSNGEKVNLGYFNTELEAHNRYMEALPLVHLSKEEIQKHFNIAQFTSNYKGISWHKAHKKWESYIKVNGNQKHLGYFTSEEEAYQAYLSFKEQNPMP